MMIRLEMDNCMTVVNAFDIRRLIPYLLAMTLFAMPLSSTGKSIFLGLSVLAILVSYDYRQHLMAVLRKPWCIASLALAALTVLACFWSPASFKEQSFVVSKFSKLIYLPILAVGFTNPKARRYGVHAFILAMLLTSLLAITKYYGFLPTLHISPDHVFRNHIMTGLMVSFASYLCFFICYQQYRKNIAWVYLATAFILSWFLLFVNEGRTGYITYLLLMLLLIIQLCSWRQAIAGIVLVGSVFTVSYFQSPVMREQVNSIAEQLHDYKASDEGKNTSIGFRLQFHHFAEHLFLQHPIIGNGTASFTYYFRILNPVPAWTSSLSPIPHGLLEPHGLYWLIAAEYGVLGLLILAWFFYTLFLSSWRLTSMKIIALGMLGFFMVGNLSDSLLFYSGSGYFFLLFMAICLGEELEQDISNNSSSTLFAKK